MGNKYKYYQINISDWKLANKQLKGKKKDLVQVSSRRSMTLSDDRPRIM